MPGKTRPSLRQKTLLNVARSNLSVTDKKCIVEVFRMFEKLMSEQKVKYGKWSTIPHAPDDPYCYECSRCGLIEDKKYDYCHCGAKMDVTDINVGSK